LFKNGLRKNSRVDKREELNMEEKEKEKGRLRKQ